VKAVTKIDGYYRWGRKPDDGRYGCAERKVWKSDRAYQCVVWNRTGVDLV